MSILENQIPIEQRFTTKNEQEFHVFSTERVDATGIDKWIGIDAPHRVLMDTETYARLRNRRIEWKIDSTLTAVIITEEVKGK